MRELIVELLELGGKDALAGEEQGVGHFAEREAESKGWSGEECRAMQGFGQDCGELRVGHGLWRDDVEGAGDVGVFYRKAENGGYIFESDPTQPLRAGADFSTNEELKGPHHLREGAALSGEDYAEAGADYADAEGFGFLGFGFPFFCEFT